jgi:dihydroxyacetone kinase-like predicted kinase
VLDSLDASAVRAWYTAALAALTRHQREIDALNVFPVADADTGTNLVLTFQAAVAAVEAPPADESARDVFARAAKGAALGARGNSGMIVSQLLAGAAAALPADRPIRGRALAAALTAAATAAYAAVAEPMEGTVLSVARSASVGAVEADSDDLGAVTAAAVKAAALALESTPAQLVSMGLPGVADAGGSGLVVLLDALDLVVRGSVEPGRARLVAAPPGTWSGGGALPLPRSGVPEAQPRPERGSLRCATSSG